MHPKNSGLLTRSRSWILLVIACVAAGCGTFRWGNPEMPSESSSEDGAEDIGDDQSALPSRESFSRTPVPGAKSSGGEPPALSWPVPMSTRLTQSFSSGPLKKHFGLDLADRTGTWITAAHDGWVTYAGSDFRGYGKLVILETESGWGTMYGHCQKILVREGSRIYRGQKIAKMGRTGNAHGVHLHFELMRESKPVDPVPYLGERRKVAGH